MMQYSRQEKMFIVEKKEKEYTVDKNTRLRDEKGYKERKQADETSFCFW